MVPLLALDAQRIGEAQRTRADGASRLTIMRAITSNALDRALDVAATLEVRGYSSARRPPRDVRALSRQDVAFGGAAVAVAVLASYAAVARLAPFGFYPTISGSFGVTQVALAVALLVAALLPFTQRRGVGR
jgi:energy-coupling factor transport system permease protein